MIRIFFGLKQNISLLTIINITKYLLLTLLIAACGVTAAETPIEDNEYVIFYHNDVLGSPIAVSDGKGRVLWYENTDPYGDGLGRTSGDRLTSVGNPIVESADSRIGFTGHEKDNTSGLTYMKARHYDPILARFYSNDPVGPMADYSLLFNRYSYAANSPFNYIDPDGRTPLLLLATPPGQATVAASLSAVGALATAVSGYYANKIAGQLQRELVGDLVMNNEESSDENPPTDGTTNEKKLRQSKGGDGGVSEQDIERDSDDNAISRTHKVVTDGEIVHQHKNHIGRSGRERQFPDSWTGTETINAPNENESQMSDYDRRRMNETE